MKRLTILILLGFCFLHAQSYLKGRVFSSTTNEPLHLANVSIPELNTGTATYSDGYFELKGNFANVEFVKVSYLGFETKNIPVFLFSENDEVDIYLDSKIISSQTVLVEGILGRESISPITFSKINRKEIEETYSVQDIPEFLSYLPNTTFYSEGGAGIGYNYISIRGFDQRRISVSVNGIPQNEPEDHNVYWLDMPDLIGNTELIQVQRGAGSGVTGYPAVGGSINIITSAFSDKPRFEFGASIGTYNTRKYSAAFSSGLINNKYSVYVKISQLLSSGYRQMSWVDFKSFHISAVRYDENLTTQINIFGGPVADALVYNGLPKSFMKDKELRKENYSWWGQYGEDLYTTVRRPDEKENFSQPHFELLNEYKFSNDFKFNSALFLILGNGYFDYDGSWATPDYGYDDYFRLKLNDYISDSDNGPTNVLIRAMVENKQWGWIPRFSLKHQNGELVFGGEMRFHNSVHWGALEYGEAFPEGISKDYKYYYYEGGKNIFNAFVNENLQLNNNLNLLAEVQLAYHQYKLNNEKFVGNDLKVSDLFINPRIGINYKFGENSNGYFAFARVSREPRLKNYYDAAESSGGAVPQFEKLENGEYDWDSPFVQPETMNSFELGGNYSSGNLSLSANVFYMSFDDEIVKKGQVDRFGQPITGNMDRTVHTGIEGSAVYRLNDNFEIILNGAYSKNYISKGMEYLNYNDEVVAIDLKNNSISGFPDVTFNGIIKYRNAGFTASLLTKYVGDFYSDNYEEKISEIETQYPGLIDYNDNKVDAYFTANLIVNYELMLKPYFNKVKMFVQINNLFDKLYASYAIGKEFFPAAERNILVGLTVGL